MKRIMKGILCLSLLFGCTSKTKFIPIEGIKEIKYEELIKNLNSDVTFMLYIGRPDCGDCMQFYPLIEDYVKTHQGSGLYYLNIKSFRDASRNDDATQQEKDFYDHLYEELHFDWTPTIHIISNGHFKKTYQYLDENYYKIKDRHLQKQRKQEFVDEFYEFMDLYFREVNNEKMS